MIIGKKHRLPRNCYIGYVRCAFTPCVLNRKPLFVSPETVSVFTGLLRKAIAKHHAKNTLYTFMPDHCHIILEGTTEQSDLWAAMTLFKQLTGYAMIRLHPGFQWQKDFYDHLIRTDDEFRRHIRYVADNPVRRGMVKDAMEYPFTGSLDYELKDILG